MNEEEARKIIDNMSEQELNDFIFFALQEVEKENQKLKAELEKKDKIIDLMEDEINKILKDGFERIGLDVYLEKENITVREFIERKLNSSEQIEEEN